MEKIKIGTINKFYEIKDIRPVSCTVLQIVFASQAPSVFGDIKIYTEDGTEAGILTGYETIFRKDGQTIYLSNDGSIYQESEKQKERSKTLLEGNL